VVLFFPLIYLDGRQCTEHNRNWYVANFCCRVWLDYVLIIVPVAIDFFESVLMI
jgi:hypothetical protein